MEIHEDIVAAIGNTPLVRLARIHPPGNLVAKVEYLNPGGSVKDRIGLGMIERAEENGWLKPGGTIVEPTSGNTGVGLAMAAAFAGYKLIAVMADKQSKEKQDLLRAYGAEVVVCPTDVEPDDPALVLLGGRPPGGRGSRGVPARPVLQPGQSAGARTKARARRLWRQTDGTIGVLVAGVGTGGTISANRPLPQGAEPRRDRRRRRP